MAQRRIRAASVRERVLVALLAAPLPLLADGEPRLEPIDIGFEERTGRSLLFLDVEAVDQDGEPLVGLRQPDFRIRVNYVWRRIYSVDDLCPCGPPDPSPAADDALAAARAALVRAAPHFVLYFDFSQLQHAGRAQALLEARRWAAEVMQPGDRVMVVAYAGGAGLRTLTGFTNDRERVLAAIEQGSAAPELVDEFPGRYAQRQALCDDGTLSCYHVGRKEYDHARHSLESLRNFVTELDAVPERKTLLLFHENASIFPGRLYGEGASYLGSSAWDRLETRRRPDGERTRLRRESSALVPDLLELSQEVGGSATASRTELVPIACGSARTWTVNLGANLADASGGDFNRRPDEARELLARAGRGCRCIYRIGLEMDARENSIVLRTKVVAAGRRLPARHQLQVLTDADRWMRKAQLVLANPESWRELDVGAALVPLRPRGKRWEAEVQVAFELSGLTIAAGDAGPAAEWEAAALLFDGEGERHWEMLGVWRASPGSGLRLDTPVVHARSVEDLPPGRYVLRAFVHDRTSDRFGAAAAEIELPAPGLEALAGPLALRPEAPRLLSPLPPRRARPGAPAAPDRVEPGRVPLGDDPRVVRGRAIEFLTLVCAAEPAVARSAVRPDEEDRAYESRTEPLVPDGDGGCSRLLQTVDTGRLDPGRYRYEIDAGLAGGAASAAFEVVPVPAADGTWPGPAADPAPAAD